MTPTQLAAKRSKRNAASRAKAKEKYRLMGEMDQANARARDKRNDYLADLGMAQQAQEKKSNDARRWALESRRSKAGVSEPTPNSLVSRVKSFFKGRGR
jgi:hypothetical protein